jgi:hypothetical protein
MKPWDITKWIFVSVGAVLLILAATFCATSPPQSDGEVAEATRIRGLGNQFDATTVTLVAPFDTLITTANTRIDSLAHTANSFRSASSIIDWISIAITATITILAAFAGLDPRQLPTQGRRRSRIVIVIAVLAAISSSLLLVNEKLERSAADARKTANALYDKASAARRAFLDSRDRFAAEKAKDDLFHALAEAGDEVR